ncbi:MAG: hypothetical protein GX605_05435 [Chloroflexi bacterium]|nr:hypothetical protein [Chloroflexota bacterium]
MQRMELWFRQRAQAVALAAMALLAVAVAGLAFAASPLWPLLTLTALALLLGVWWGWPRSGLLLLLAAGMLSRYDAEVLGRSLKAEHVAVLAVLGLLGAQVLLDKRRPVVTLAGFWALAWLLWNGAATLLSPIVIAAAPNHLFKLTLMVGAYLCVVNLVRDQATLRWAFRAWLAVGTVAAAWGLLVWLIYLATRVNLGIQMTNNLPAPVPYGTLLEGNIYGSHAASLAAAYAALVLTRPGARLWGPRLRWTDVGLAATTLAVLIGMSRGSWLGLAAALGLGLLTTRRLSSRPARRLALTALLILLALVALLLVVELAPKELSLVNRLASFTRLDEEVTVVGRLSKYEAAFTSWLERPAAGWGTGSMATLYASRGRRWAWISNLTLHLLLDTGIIGLLLFAGFVVTLFWRGFRAAAAAGPTFHRRMLLGLLSGFAGLLVAYQSTEATWLVLPWIHAGLLTAATRLPLSPEEAPARAPTA